MPTPTQPHQLTLKSTLLINILVAGLYFSLGKITFNTYITEFGSIGNIAEFSSIANMIFAPAGVWLAFGILFGPKATVLGILIGQTLLSYWVGPSIISGVFIALFNALACIAGHYLFHRWKLSCNFNTLRDVTLFSVLVLFILQPFIAAGAIATLSLLERLPLNAIPTALYECRALWAHQEPSALRLTPTAWLNWWLSGVMGQLLFAPLLITWLTPSTRNTTPIKALEVISYTTAITAIVLISLSNIPSAQLLILAVTYPLLVWSGMRHGIRNTTFTNAFIVFLIIFISTSGHGFMANLSVVDRFYYLSFFIISATLFSLILFAMFDERRQLIQQLTALANTDFLTKLGNRAYFMDRGEQAVAQARRHNIPLSLAILDIDKFKKINDTYGHAAGDEVIKNIALQCKSLLRTEDISARIGGEEFAFVFPNTTKENSYIVIERLRLAVQNHPIQINESTQITVTFSAGIAQLEHNESLVDLLQLADKMLYKSKKLGRNQVTLSLNE